MNLDDANRMDRPEFVATFGGIFEHSPWLAARGFDARQGAASAR